jgi:hypothetical protein
MNGRTLSRALAVLTLAAGTAAWGADPPVTPPPATPAPATPTATNVVGPRIQFETLVHDFGRAKSGEVVKYTYIFTNTGNQLLEVSGIQACGCITADWTRKVEPGKTGSIPIGFNSSGYGGQVVKPITVTCNDRINPRPMLQFKGTIWKPIDVVPLMVVLNLTPDSPQASATVLLTNNLPEPITVSAPESNNRAFAAELKVLQPGKAFQVVIAPTTPLPQGSAQAQIILKTSSTNAPVVSITAFANVQPVVTINPLQVTLPPGPLAQPQTISLNLIDNSTNLMTLSEPGVNVSGVDVQLKEVLPGRNYTATLTFPQGFEIAPGQTVHLNIKSSLSLMPNLRVPIRQLPRLAPPPLATIKRPTSISTNKHRVLPPIELPPVPP